MKTLRFVLLAVLVAFGLFGGSAFAGAYDSIGSAVVFTDVSAGIVNIGAALAAVYVVFKGVGLILGRLKR